MIIQRMFSEKKKSEKDEKKAKAAAGIAAGSGLASVGADLAAGKQLDKADKIWMEHNRNLDKRAKRIAKKTGTHNYVGTFLWGDPEKVKKGEEMAKRHDRVVKRAIEKRVNAANKMSAGSVGLTAASIGSGLYALKKKKDAKKAEKEENK